MPQPPLYDELIPLPMDLILLWKFPLHSSHRTLLLSLLHALSVRSPWASITSALSIA